MKARHYYQGTWNFPEPHELLCPLLQEPFASFLPPHQNDPLKCQLHGKEPSIFLLKSHFPDNRLPATAKKKRDSQYCASIQNVGTIWEQPLAGSRGLSLGEGSTKAERQPWLHRLKGTPQCQNPKGKVQVFMNLVLHYVHKLRFQNQFQASPRLSFNLKVIERCLQSAALILPSWDKLECRRQTVSMLECRLQHKRRHSIITKFSECGDHEAPSTCFASRTGL